MDHTAQRELDHLLTTRIDPHTNQGKILRYLGEAALAGREEGLKEYSIATEALGRPTEFDPKTDSIVRVEMHKLRKTLREYYAGPGAGRPVEIAIEPGTYAPVFVSRSGAGQAGAPRARPGVVRWTVPLVAVALAGAAVVWSTRTPRAQRAQPSQSPPVPEPGPASATPMREVRIAAGSQSAAFIDSLGRTWLPDRYYTGGRITPDRQARILNVRDPQLFQNRREGDFVYNLPLAPGLYEVRLYFAETYYGPGNSGEGGETSRLFRVTINDEPVLGAIDVIAQARGSNLGIVKVFPGRRPDADGYLRIRFESLVRDRAFVNAIEVVPGLDGRMLPIRMSANSRAITDPAGRLWESDRFVSGGRLLERATPVSGGPDPALFAAERFGYFSYRLPALTTNSYTLRLWFAEQFFGVSAPPSMVRQRRFDIYVNGVALARNLDVRQEAGGPLRALSKTFSRLVPDAQGFLQVEFVPVENYPLINGLEMIDDGPRR